MGDPSTAIVGTDALTDAWQDTDKNFADSPVGSCTQNCPLSAKKETPAGCRYLEPGGSHAQASPTAYERGRKNAGKAKLSKPKETTKAWRKGDPESKAIEQDVDI